MTSAFFSVCLRRSLVIRARRVLVWVTVWYRLHKLSYCLFFLSIRFHSKRNTKIRVVHSNSNEYTIIRVLLYYSSINKNYFFLRCSYLIYYIIYHVNQSTLNHEKFIWFSKNFSNFSRNILNFSNILQNYFQNIFL